MTDTASVDHPATEQQQQQQQQTHPAPPREEITTLTPFSGPIENSKSCNPDSLQDAIHTFRQLNRKCLAAYVELCDVLCGNQGYLMQMKVDAIRNILLDMHFIINKKFLPAVALADLVEIKRSDIQHKQRFIEQSERFLNSLT
jgi:hypothetical protein